MPRNYERKRIKLWTKDDIQNAVKEYREKYNNNKKSCRSIANDYNIPEATLRRYIKLNEEEYPVNGGRFRNTFSDEQLLKLKEYITDIERRSFGLTKVQCQKLVYEYALDNNIPHRFNTESKKKVLKKVQVVLKKKK